MCFPATFDTAEDPLELADTCFTSRKPESWEALVVVTFESGSRRPIGQSGIARPDIFRVLPEKPIVRVRFNGEPPTPKAEEKPPVVEVDSL